MHVGSAAFKYIHQENSSKNVRTCRFYVDLGAKSVASVLDNFIACLCLNVW